MRKTASAEVTEVHNVFAIAGRIRFIFIKYDQQFISSYFYQLRLGIGFIR